MFADGGGLFDALLSMVERVDGGIGAYGGHLRELQGAFLDEAAVILDRAGARPAADAWRAAGDLWQDLADAAVPADLDGARRRDRGGRGAPRRGDGR